MLPAAPILEGNVLFQFELNTGTDRKYVLSNTNTQHVSSRVTESAFGPTTGSHTFHCQSLDLPDRVLREAFTNGQFLLQFRVGVRTPNRTRWSHWQVHTVVQHALVPHGSEKATGYTLKMETVDQEFQMNIQPRTAAHRGTLSAIVENMALAYGLETVVEPTQFEGLYYQVNQGGADFIRQRLLPRALTAQGLAGYHFFIRDGVLHFHSASYENAGYSLDYYASGGSMLVFTDLTQTSVRSGRAGVRLVRYDPYTGLGVELESNPEQSLRYESVAYVRNNQPERMVTLAYHTGANGDGESLALAQNRYHAVREQQFKTQLTLPRYCQVRAGHLLDLIAAPSGVQASSYSGLWLVSGRTLDIENNACVTAYTLVRGETGPMLAGSDPAPGQQVNLAVLKNEESSRTTAVLLDP